MNFETKATAALSGVVDILKYVTGMQEGRETLGERIVKSDDVQKFNSGQHDQVRIPLTNLEIKTAIIGSGSQNDPLNMTLRPAIAEGARRRLFLRDILRQGETSEAAIEYPVEASFTNTAAIQDRENTSMTESGATFTLSFKAVQTIGHYATVSKQVLEDSSVLDAYLQNTLLYGLRLEEENQILNGDGSNSELDGLLNNATAYAVQSPNLTNEVDIIREMIKQAQVADYSPDAIVLNPVDWYSIAIRKAGSSDDVYVAGNPHDMGAPRLWGLPVVVTNSISSGVALVGDFARGAALFDRQEAAIEISRHHSDNWTKNMVTMLAVERVGLVVTNGAGLITASI